MMRCSLCESNSTNYNYCPNCGRALTEESKKLENSKVLNTRLETLLKLVDVIDDQNTLVKVKDLVININNSIKD